MACAPLTPNATIDRTLTASERRLVSLIWLLRHGTGTAYPETVRGGTVDHSDPDRPDRTVQPGEKANTGGMTSPGARSRGAPVVRPGCGDPGLADLGWVQLERFEPIRRCLHSPSV